MNYLLNQSLLFLLISNKKQHDFRIKFYLEDQYVGKLKYTYIYGPPLRLYKLPDDECLLRSSASDCVEALRCVRFALNSRSEDFDSNQPQHNVHYFFDHRSLTEMGDI